MNTTMERQRPGLFLATDRCDRCGARAQVRVLLATGELLFCNHHDRKFREVIEPIAFRIEYNPVP